MNSMSSSHGGGAAGAPAPAASTATGVKKSDNKKQRVAEDSKPAVAVAAPSPSSILASSSSSYAAPPSTPTAGGSGGAKAVAKSKFCLNCQKELTRNIRITCVECLSSTTQRPLVELCVECFAVGIELGDHKRSHKYTVSDCLAYPVVRESREYVQSLASAAMTTQTPQKDGASGSGSGAQQPAATATAAALSSDWTADEELLLLEGIEMFGMGNWKDIAEHVGTKSEKKCETHYMGAYLSTSDLMPRFLNDPEVLDATEEKKPAAAAGLALTPAKPSALSNGTTSTTSATTTVAPSPSVPQAKNPGSELAGYMPLRGDFDVEYDNEAELILADMEFSEDDHPTERELKLKVIEIYNAKLDERERRKRFVIERGLLDYKKHQQSERRRPKDERELIAQMRPFARYQTPKEHDDFINGLITAMRLRKQILLLQEYRKNGVRTLAEAELYDVEKKKRETEQALQKQRDSAAYLYESGRPASSGRDRANRWLNREQSSDTAGPGGDKSSGRGGAASGGSGDQDGAAHPRTRGSIGGGGSGASGSGAGDGSSASSFLVDGAPGCHLLTPQEKELCSKLKLLPKHYLVIKDALIRECFRLGYLSKKNAKEVVKIDVSKTGQIYDFFVKCGWVKTESSVPKVSASPKSKSAATENGTPSKKAAAIVAAAQPPPTTASSMSTSAAAAAPTTPSSSSATPAKRKAHEISSGATGSAN